MLEKHEKILAEITELNPYAIKLDGYDDCLVGICNSFHGYLLVYSEEKIIEKLEKEMSLEKALEYYDYNFLGGNYGTHSPVYFYEMKYLEGE